MRKPTLAPACSVLGATKLKNPTKNRRLYKTRPVGLRRFVPQMTEGASARNSVARSAGCASRQVLRMTERTASLSGRNVRPQLKTPER